jgi:pyruvate dehydrogenase (quinone)
VVLVLHNNDLSLVSWEMRAMQGAPRFEATQRLPECDYAAFANIIGLTGIRVERPEEIASAWEQAFSALGPVVLDAVCDPNVPPLPPHVTWKQSTALLSSLLKGDSDAGDIVRQIVKSKAAELVH